jgi:hypothetical protein
MTAAINVLNSTKNLSILGRPKSVAQYTGSKTQARHDFYDIICSAHCYLWSDYSS